MQRVDNPLDIFNMFVQILYLSGNLIFLGASERINFTNHVIHFGFPAVQLNLDGSAIVFNIHDNLLLNVISGKTFPSGYEF